MAHLRIAVLIDGGFLRVQAKRAHKTYTASFIEAFAHLCKAEEEHLFRVLYYDCAPFSGKVKLPVSGAEKVFTSNDEWLNTLSYKDLFAVRRGILKFRGFVPKRRSGKKQADTTASPFTDNDFEPSFEQKGVDMRIGLDIATYSTNHAVDRIALVSGDTDCIPALKHARKAGLQTVLVKPGKAHLAPELLAHADYIRPVALP